MVLGTVDKPDLSKLQSSRYTNVQHLVPDTAEVYFTQIKLRAL